MSQMTGADVAQLRDLAHLMDSEAGRLFTLRNRIAGRLVTTAWSGPDAGRFKVEWVKHVVGLTGAALMLSECAQRLRKDADEQQDASSDKGSYAVPTNAPRSPTSTADLLAAGDAAGSDGVRIQKVIGPDGEERYIVYIGGTGAEGNMLNPLNPFDAGENSNAVVGLDSQASLMIKRKMHEAGIDSSSEVMFVGYSQGGIYAQTLARSLQWDTPPMVVTRGAPEVAGSMGDVDIVRLEVKHDGVLDHLNPNKIANSIRETLVGDGPGTDYTSSYDPQLTTAESVALALSPAAALGIKSAIHREPVFYQQAAEAFDRDDNHDARLLQNRMSEFRGTVISDTDGPASRV